MVIPAITDVTMLALCPGKDECSIAIYLSGFQQAVTGLGSLMLMPVVGNLSDSYGRKALLTLPMTLSVFPLAILGCGRTKYYFYAYYVLKTLTAMFCEGSVLCLSLAYVADNISEGRRASAFGILSGVASAAFVCGTLTARFLSTPSTFQVSALVAILATLYMRSFLTDSSSNCNFDSSSSSRLISKDKVPVQSNRCGNDSCPKLQIGKRIPSVEDMIHLLRTSLTFTQAAIVAFFHNLAEGGLRESLLFYLKARFHFNKDQFADILLIVGVAGAISQLLLMPILAPNLGEEKLLRIGLLAGCAHIFLYSISWASWVPYLATTFSILAVFSSPCIRSIASKQVGPEEQGKAQGCISGICSFANIVSPLVFTPLTGCSVFPSSFVPVRKSTISFPGFQSYVHRICNGNNS
ncbi:Tetracycline resistance protein [Macleaya cordata]|uniref:Tetracycline resistance protein n=1 Tax=Macleaya cordata TaxID=56857 RepID=A0A200QZV0_MACCD|nr:Tetracycline resistance protein [Macleaya cordata]